MNENQKYRDLLHETARLHERWCANRPEPFNVFTVLRSASDEVNLHSRFLHALLNHVDPTSRNLENLKAFLSGVVDTNDFNLECARVERERNHIDLLIKNDNKQAVIIENKIWARDAEGQLKGYRDVLVEQGYADVDIHIVYLTPYGREPDRNSLGDIPIKEVVLVSYRDELQDWLIGCQRRAFNEPELRESIKQYIHLIRRMTNTDHTGEHMSELKNLLMQDDNLVLADQLSRAMVHAKAALVRKLYQEVDRALLANIGDLPGVDPDYAHYIEEDTIRNCIEGKRNSDSGLYYKIAEESWLMVAGSNRIWVGVGCDKIKFPELFERYAKALTDVNSPNRRDNWAPWYQYVHDMPSWSPSKEWFHLHKSNRWSLRFLSGDVENRAKVVEEIANTLALLWEKIKKDGIVD